MTLGQKVQELISTNIKIWHEDTLVRSNASIPLEEKARLFLAARVLNSQRNSTRDSIDQEVKEDSYSTKINYYDKKEK